ncbi:MAG: phosphoglycerate mutase, partial [Eubacteriales bacterium]
ITADTDTNLLLKAKATCSLLKDYEFVFVHINGADEASHRRDCLEKVRFIERIDKEFVAYLLNNIDKRTKVMLCSDHATDPVSGKHAHLSVPVIIQGVNFPVTGTDSQILSLNDVRKYLLSV